MTLYPNLTLFLCLCAHAVPTEATRLFAFLCTTRQYFVSTLQSDCLAFLFQMSSLADRLAEHFKGVN